MTKRSSGQDSAAAMEALYPFLYPGTAPDLDAVLAEVRASTVAKAREITELRQAICARDAGRLAACAQQMAARFAAGGRLLAFGNGGSATDAQQLATLFLDPGPGERALPAFCLANDTAVVTALCNDVGVEVVFARQVAAFGQPSDIAIGLSTSGNSENLLRALDEAARHGMLTVGIAGYDGGKMAELDSLDYLFVAPSSSVHRIQEAQTTVYHALWELTVASLPGAGTGTGTGTVAGMTGDKVPGAGRTGRTLVACLGNIFLSDDGFGVEVARRLAREQFPEGVRVTDYGIRGMHLAYDLAEGFDTTILVDTAQRGDAPGTVYLIEPEPREGQGDTAQLSLFNAHGMQPDLVLSLAGSLGGDAGRVLVVGCEPATLEEGIGLSPPVTAAVDEAAAMITRLVTAGQNTQS